MTSFDPNDMRGQSGGPDIFLAFAVLAAVTLLAIALDVTAHLSF